MSRRVGVNSKGEMFDHSEEQTAGTMAEEYDRIKDKVIDEINAQKSVNEEILDLLVYGLDAIYNSSYDDNIKKKALRALQLMKVQVVFSDGRHKLVPLDNILIKWFHEKKSFIRGTPIDLIKVPEDPDADMVNNPSHYQSYIKDGIDCITAMQHAFGKEATAIFCKLNAFKYNWRAESKNGNEDIFKAIWYLNKYLELNK